MCIYNNFIIASFFNVDNFINNKWYFNTRTIHWSTRNFCPKFILILAIVNVNDSYRKGVIYTISCELILASLTLKTETELSIKCFVMWICGPKTVQTPGVSTHFAQHCPSIATRFSFGRHFNWGHWVCAQRISPFNDIHMIDMVQDSTWFHYSMKIKNHYYPICFLNYLNHLL